LLSPEANASVTLATCEVAKMSVGWRGWCGLQGWAQRRSARDHARSCRRLQDAAVLRIDQPGREIIGVRGKDRGLICWSYKVGMDPWKARSVSTLPTSRTWLVRLSYPGLTSRARNLSPQPTRAQLLLFGRFYAQRSELQGDILLTRRAGALVSSARREVRARPGGCCWCIWSATRLSD
jgi:hypothetical protein